MLRSGDGEAAKWGCPKTSPKKMPKKMSVQTKVGSTVHAVAPGLDGNVRM